MPSAKDNLKETNDIVYTEDSIKMYLREINKHKLLTKEEEKDLSNKLKNS